MKSKSTVPDRFTVLDTINLSESYLEEVYYEIVEALR